jgi:hypothetical protein
MEKSRSGIEIEKSWSSTLAKKEFFRMKQKMLHFFLSEKTLTHRKKRALHHGWTS